LSAGQGVLRRQRIRPRRRRAGEGDGRQGVPHPGGVPAGRDGGVAAAGSGQGDGAVPEVRAARAPELPGARVQLGAMMAREPTGRAMDSEDFGGLLRSARQRKGLTIADLSRATKIKESQLERLEAAALDALPAEVFVVGFIKAYAREVGIDGAEALRRYSHALPKPQIIETALIEQPEAPPVQ